MKIRFSFILILTLFFFSCKKRGCTDPVSSNYDENAEINDGTCEYAPATVQLNLHHLYNNIPFSFDSIYEDDFGNNIQFSRATFYMGNPIYKDSSDFILDSSNYYTLISPENIENDFSIICSGYVKTLNLLIGVDPVTNHLDPASYNSSNSLSYQSPSMHWQMSSNPQNWSYLFIVLEGKIDIDGNGSFDPGENYVLHVGNDGLTNNISGLSIERNVFQGEIVTIDLNVNWDGFFENIDLSIDNFTHTSDNIPLATTISNNAVNVISIH